MQQLEPRHANQNTLPETATQAQWLDKLIAEADRLNKKGREGALNSQTAFKSDLQHLRTWLKTHLDAQLPIDPHTLGLYLTHQSTEDKFSTLQRRLTSITKWHLRAGEPSPTGDILIQDLMEGIKRDIGIDVKQAQAYEIGHFKAVIRRFGITLPDLRDKAMLLLGFTGAFRRSELVALNVEDLCFTCTETNVELVVTYFGSKTNQYGQKEEKAIFGAEEIGICPVRSLHAYLTATGLSSGPLFVRMRRTGRQETHTLTGDRLSDRQVDLLVRRELGTRYSAHSLRASFVTEAKLNGAQDSEIMHQTKHKTTAMIRRYTRLDEIKKHNAAKKLGL